MLDLDPGAHAVHKNRFSAPRATRVSALVASVHLVACAPVEIPTVLIHPAPPEPAPFVREILLEAEPYEPSLQALLAPEAMVPFAAYLDTVHRRVHPIFVESFLVEFERGRARGSSIGSGEPEYATTLAIALGEYDGRLSDLRIVRSSGLETFDVGVMGALIRASPFGKPPPEIVGEDGSVHLSWRLRRRGPDGCGVQNALIVAPADL
jgi:hypothetical protein